MNSIKKIFIFIFLPILIIFMAVFIASAIFMSNNYISFNQHINTKNVSELVIIDDTLNSRILSLNDNDFSAINNILKNSKISFYSDGLIEYDTEKDIIELKSKTKTKRLYTYISENGNILIIINDLFEKYDTSIKLDYPYYIVAEISHSDFYTIFPNSSLLSDNCISIYIEINDQKITNNKYVGEISIRNDNDCAIILEEVNCNDEYVSIISNTSKDIAPHSNSKFELEIKSDKDNENIKKHFKESNCKFTFCSTENSNDKCYVSSESITIF